MDFEVCRRRHGGDAERDFDFEVCSWKHVGDAVDALGTLTSVVGGMGVCKKGIWISKSVVGGMWGGLQGVPFGSSKSVVVGWWEDARRAFGFPSL